MSINALVGQPAPPDPLVDPEMLRAAYYARTPDLSDRAQRVVFGSGGHCGSALRGAFNEAHVRAITQAICEYRHQYGIGGPLFIGRDMHPLSEPAFATAVEVLSVSRVRVMLEANGGCTPAPAVSRAILTHNRCPASGAADGIVVTAAHNTPANGGVRYIPPSGGPADTSVTRWIEARANRLLQSEGAALSRLSYARARRPNTTQVYGYVDSYVRDLGDIVDMDAIRHSGLRIGVDPMRGAAGAVWAAAADRYGINIAIVDRAVDPGFRTTSIGQDGQIGANGSSPYAMAAPIGLSDRFDIVFCGETDAGSHGIVSRGAGLMSAHDYAALATSFLFTHRPAWAAEAAVGRTAVSSSLIDRVASRLERRVVEVPFGFKWFAPDLLAGTLGFAAEESGGATFLQRDGAPWTTDTDGIAMDLLALELMARTGRAPSESYAELTADLGMPLYSRTDVPATPEEEAVLACMSPQDVTATKLAGEPVLQVLTAAPGNGLPLGGLKVTSANGWFAARPSATAGAYELYAETFKGGDHLQRIQAEARAILSRALVRGLR
jgi:phosphoglucomutase